MSTTHHTPSKPRSARRSDNRPISKKVRRYSRRDPWFETDDTFIRSEIILNGYLSAHKLG